MPIVNASVSPQLAAAIQAAVDEGIYASESEVVREALQLWSDKHRWPHGRETSKTRDATTRREWLDTDKLCVADLFAAHSNRISKLAY